jgi:hypothetical protein
MDHHRMLLLSIVYQLVRSLLGLTAMLARRNPTGGLGRGRPGRRW